MKTLRFIGMAFIAVVLSMSIYSCSDDDDDNDGGGGSSSSPKSDVSVITTKDGDHLLVERIGSSGVYVRFNYDSQGRCTGADCWCDWTISMSYDPFKIVIESDPLEDMSTSMSFNSSGYISKVNMDYHQEEYDEDDSESYSLSYDSNGHLTKISGSASGRWTEDGVKYSGTATSDMTLTWENGDIIKVVRNGKDKVNGYTYEYQETFTYEYGSTENEYQQYTLAITNEAFEWTMLYADLALIGYMGKGTSHLPTSLKAVFEDGYTDSYTCTYTKNSDGTIKTEKGSSTTTDNYTYASLDSDTRSAEPTYEDVLSTQWNTNVERKHTLGFRSKFLKRHNSQK